MAKKFDIGRIKLLINPNKTIRDISPIQEQESINVKQRSDLKNIIEEPCLQTAYDLYNKNIQTVYSGANNNNSEIAFIGIKFDTLNQTNRSIAINLVMQGILKQLPPVMGRNPFTILQASVPTTLDSRVIDVSEQLADLVQSFKSQDILFNRYRPQEIMDEIIHNKERYGAEYITAMFGTDVVKNGTLTIKQIETAKNLIYDAESGDFFTDIESLRRHREFIKNNPLRIMTPPKLVITREK